jgi:hypothetical protein
MIVSLDQQIDWMERQVRYQRKSAPKQVELGRLSQEEATHALACASCALQTLTQLRGLVRAGLETPP